jgi:hypothetical protein
MNHRGRRPRQFQAYPQAMGSHLYRNFIGNCAVRKNRANKQANNGGGISNRDNGASNRNRCNQEPSSKWAWVNYLLKHFPSAQIPLSLNPPSFINATSLS